VQQQPSHPPLSPFRQPPEATFADPLPTLHLQFCHLRALFADPSLRGGRRGSEAKAVSSTDFPPVAATGAEEGEGADASTEFPPVAATRAQRSPAQREPSAYGSREPDRATNPRARVTSTGVDFYHLFILSHHLLSYHLFLVSPHPIALSSKHPIILSPHPITPSSNHPTLSSYPIILSTYPIPSCPIFLSYHPIILPIILSNHLSAYHPSLSYPLHPIHYPTLSIPSYPIILSYPILAYPILSSHRESSLIRITPGRSCHCIILSYRLIIQASYHPITLSPCHPITLSSYHPTLSSYPIILSTYPILSYPIFLSYHAILLRIILSNHLSAYHPILSYPLHPIHNPIISYPTLSILPSPIHPILSYHGAGRVGEGLKKGLFRQGGS